MSSEAKVEVCATCREHGRIVFGDGTKSREFWTKFKGFDIIVAHKDEGLLTQGEAFKLAKQVSRAGFPRNTEGIRHSAAVCPEFRAVIREVLEERAAQSAAS